MTNAATVNTNCDLVNNSCMMAKVVRPYLKDGQLVGAVLSFEGKRNTALLHVRQMNGEDAASRLKDFSVGDEMRVRVMVVDEGGSPRIWATEKGVETMSLLDAFATEPKSFANIDGLVHGITDFGIFVELLGSTTKGQRGLVRLSSLNEGRGRVTFGSLIQYKVGDAVHVDLAEARTDEKTGKLLLRLENLRPRLAN